MKRGTRLSLGIALACAALGVTAACAAAANPATDARQVKPGLSDFGLASTEGSDSPRPVTDARQVKPGLGDFGLTPRTEPVASPAVEAVTTEARGFDWSAAGVGAAATLGIVLVIGGLGAAVLLRGHRGEYRSA